MRDVIVHSERLVPWMLCTFMEHCSDKVIMVEDIEAVVGASSEQHCQPAL
jgi:hypothetical protein